MANIFYQNNIFVSASEEETFGLTLLEAMASSLPVVGSNINGCGELIQEGINGLKSMDNSVGNYVELLIRLTNNLDLYNTLSQGAHQFAKQFTWDNAMGGRTHYEVLGIDKSANLEQIKAAFNRLALITHPDKNNQSDAAFIEVSTAYQTLKDPKSRREYNYTLYLKTQPPVKIRHFQQTLLHCLRSISLKVIRVLMVSKDRR